MFLVFLFFLLFIVHIIHKLLVDFAPDCNLLSLGFGKLILGFGKFN